MYLSEHPRSTLNQFGRNARHTDKHRWPRGQDVGGQSWVRTSIEYLTVLATPLARRVRWL